MATVEYVHLVKPHYSEVLSGQGNQVGQDLPKQDSVLHLFIGNHTIRQLVGGCFYKLSKRTPDLLQKWSIVFFM